MSITIIAAIGNNGEIGLNGKLPWHCPAELEHFKRTVDGHYKIVGTKTFASLPRWCKDNRLHTFTRNENIHKRCTLEGVVNFGKTKDVFILGGAETYAAFLPYADKAILSYIDGDFDADTFFPYHNMSGTADYSWVWHCLQERTTCPQSGLSFVVWEVTKQAVQP
jgi:dihydrofolate reductase